MYHFGFEGASGSYSYELDESFADFETSVGLITKSLHKKGGKGGFPEVDIPVCIFRQGLSGLRAAVKYLREEKNLKYSEISRILGRDQRTVWCTYNSVKSAKSFSFKDLYSEDYFVSSSILRNRKFSFLEALVFELHSEGLQNSEISMMLSKSQKTIWTILNRVQIKKASSVRGLK